MLRIGQAVKLFSAINIAKSGARKLTKNSIFGSYKNYQNYSSGQKRFTESKNLARVRLENNQLIITSAFKNNSSSSRIRWINNVLYSNVVLLPAAVIATTTEQDEDDKAIEKFVNSPEYIIALSSSYLNKQMSFWEKCGFIFRAILRFVELVVVASPAIITAPFALLFPSLFANVWWKLLRVTLESAGATWIKLGQWAGTRPDLFDPKLLANISGLWDRAPPHSFRKSKAIFKKAFGRGIEEVFDEFSSEPIASGAVAQVHKARLKDGRIVAVKISHPNIESKFAVDLGIMRFFARLITILPGMKWTAMDAALEQFSSTMSNQLNLLSEAKNLLVFNKNFKNYNNVKFPKLVPELASRTVIVESFEPGVPMNHYLKSPHLKKDKRRLASLGLNAYLKMMLNDNFIHADLHPGNILVRPTPKEDDLEMVFLDVGLITELSPADWENFKALFKCIVAGDGKRGAELMITRARQANVTQHEKERFTDEMDILFSEVRKQSLSQINVGLFLSKILTLVRTYRVQIESNFATLVVGTVLLEGVGRQLDPELNILDVSVPYLFLSRKATWREKLQIAWDRFRTRYLEPTAK
jgi:aarF domain-containing kinase